MSKRGSRTVAAIRRHKLLNPDMTGPSSYDMSDPLPSPNFREQTDSEIFTPIWLIYRSFGL